MAQPRNAPGPRHNQPRGWHSRGYLPHFDAGADRPQSVTFRLADSLPAEVVIRWLDELAARSRREQDLGFRKRAEAFLDAGHGECHLRDPRVGALVENALLFFDGGRYHLHAWVVMPNHVHVLVTPAPRASLPDFVGSWKSYTAKEANRLLGRTGRFWQEDYFDRFIRDEEHYARTVEYIEANPVKAGLCARAEGWPFGSARRRAAETAALPGAGPAGMIDGTDALPGNPEPPCR